MVQQDAPQPKLPGFDITYTSMPEECFGSALDDYRSPMTTLCEFTMMKLMNEVTDKHDWHKKVINNDVIDELYYKAEHFKATGFVTAYDADVVKSDTAVPEDLREALKTAVKPLEDVSESQKDWHPWPDEKVLDLVHPSLFPLVYYADPTKPGHRKILALFLVDPYIRIISTANIPCQRLDWWREVVETKQTGLTRLPRELKDQVFNQVEDFHISMEMAKTLRLELMEERKNFAGFENELEPFSLCKH